MQLNYARKNKLKKFDLFLLINIINFIMLITK